MQLRLSLRLCCLCLGLLGCVKEVKANDPSLTQRDGLLSRHGELYSGRIVTYYENGVLYKETMFRDGVQDGEVKTYALNGHLKELDHYVAGKRDGNRLGWYEEGPKKFSYFYRHGALDGLQTEWHQGGEVFRQARYVEGVESSKKVLFSGGEIFTNYVKKDDRLYGIDGGALCMDAKKEGAW